MLRNKFVKVLLLLGLSVSAISGLPSTYNAPQGTYQNPYYQNGAKPNSGYPTNTGYQPNTGYNPNTGYQNPNQPTGGYQNPYYQNNNGRPTTAGYQTTRSPYTTTHRSPYNGYNQTQGNAGNNYNNYNNNNNRPGQGYNSQTYTTVRPGTYNNGQYNTPTNTGYNQPGTGQVPYNNPYTPTAPVGQPSNNHLYPVLPNSGYTNPPNPNTNNPYNGYTNPSNTNGAPLAPLQGQGSNWQASGPSSLSYPQGSNYNNGNPYVPTTYHT